MSQESKNERAQNKYIYFLCELNEKNHFPIMLINFSLRN